MRGNRSCRSTRTVLFLLLGVSLSQVKHVAAQTPTVAPIAPQTGTPTTLAPTGFPTLSPSLAPTTLAPITVAPTLMPTTLAPTSRPSSAPSTAVPTTATPTAVPTAGPTQSPIIGTRSPVVPTDPPTVPPTLTPTAVPTTAPTLSRHVFDIPVDMQLWTMPGSLTSSQRIDWESKTAAHIQDVMENLQREENSIVQLSVSVETNVQTVLNMGEVRGTEGGVRRRRYLQGGNAPQEFILKVELVVRVTFRASSANRSQVASWIREAFNTPEERNRYISRLKATNNDAFVGLDSVEVGVDGQAPPPDDVPPPTEREDNDIMLYIIAAAGGGCALVVAGLVFLYCTRNKASRNSSGSPRRKDEIATQYSDKSPLGLAAEIVVRNNDEVSTLGDPVQLTMQPTPDEQTASIGTYGNDYDYSREYRRSHGIASDNGSLGRNESVGSRTANSASLFSSENSLDFMLEGDPRLVYRFDVNVPPGKLGVVMDNSPSGTPMVFAVKPESVLSRDVQVGDRLLAVDHEDVTVMSAIQVSKLISLKNDQERTLTFCRKRSSDQAQDM